MWKPVEIKYRAAMGLGSLKAGSICNAYLLAQNVAGIGLVYHPVDSSDELNNDVGCFEIVELAEDGIWEPSNERWCNIQDPFPMEKKLFGSGFKFKRVVGLESPIMEFIRNVDS